MFKKNKDIVKIIKEKKFNKELTTGYDALEVDTFLDNVIRYIIVLEQENESLKNRIMEKEQEIKKTKNDYDSLKRAYVLSRSELNKLIEDGYINQKVIKDISLMRNEIENLKSDKGK